MRPAPTLPTMTKAHYERLIRMSDERRLRVMERAAILHFDAGLPWPEADARALEQEGAS